VSKPKCSAQNKSGQGCRAFALADDQYCWTHSPAHAEDRRQACSAGGRKSTQLRALRGRMPRLDTSEGLIKFLARLMADTQIGEMDPGVTRVLAYCAAVQRQLIEAGDLSKRLDLLEQQLATTGALKRGGKRW
jgi:hypothetical protein